jgi:GNAT superfamily N-acetyltransferase
MIAKIVIEPLGRHHDRAAFDCGEQRVDRFLHLTAKKHMAENLAVVRVAVVENSATIIGYHSLSAHSIEAESLPPELTPKERPYAGIGAFYLGFIGVQRSFQGKGVGRLLLRDAMRQTVAASIIGGVAFLVLDALDDERAAFYRLLGFVPLPSQPLRMVIPTAVMRAVDSKNITTARPGWDQIA